MPVLRAALALALSCGAAQAQLLANGDFDVDVAPWVDPFPDASTVISWSAIDAEEPSASGSLQVETNISNNASDGPWSECLVAFPGSYSLSAQGFLASNGGLPAGASIALDFYDATSCAGDPASSAVDFVAGFDEWLPLDVEAETPVGAASLRVRILLGGTTDSVPDVARFDQIQLVPEPGGGIGAAAGLVALALSSGARRSRRARRPAAPAPPRAADRAAPSGSG